MENTHVCASRTPVDETGEDDQPYDTYNCISWGESEVLVDIFTLEVICIKVCEIVACV